MKWIVSLTDHNEQIYKLNQRKIEHCECCGQEQLKLEKDEWNDPCEWLCNSKKEAIDKMNEHDYWKCNRCEIWFTSFNIDDKNICVLCRDDEEESK